MVKDLKIVLVGLPGSGKSTFGKQLATALGFSYFDLDHLIEDRFQKKIPDIFSQYGEMKFRDLETEMLQDFLNREKSYVLASGGGCPCFNDNMDLINEKAFSVYLDVPIEDISTRLSLSKADNRPMFSGLDQGGITSKLKSLLVERDYFYSQSKIKLSGEDFSAELLVMELIRLLKS